ncbi:ribonuclease M5 [Leptotrichia buccalis]|uniref:Ribonuclease M5 n=1 Tax=Leptotrichia buccalis (strain ATCC 14201 / DSM 1135 / JCM 12969 / NCTC 10249 / C-1013-b) TaxID=523794 RepID=C7N9R2_LEPBD|nr:ribonuclease M5 [Leptotrichia buccalis]ACV38893.1 primase/topoisomerase like protein [Leptotrichia buccalis C-1013-b]
MKKEPSKQEEKLKIKEIIVVEGRDDITAIKRVVDAHIIALNGFSALSEKTINKIVELSKNNDLILFTDPDFAGKKIRDTLKKYIPNIKHAFVSQKDATRNDNIGVENANDKAILEALKNVVTANQDGKNRFNISDLIDNRFVSGSNAKERRIMLGDMLKIGYYNAKQLLKALNSFNISREQFNAAVKKINKNDI